MIIIQDVFKTRACVGIYDWCRSCVLGLLNVSCYCYFSLAVPACAIVFMLVYFLPLHAKVRMWTR